jgi:hypothetical protein
LVDAVLQVLKMVRIHGIHCHEDHRLGLFETWELLDKLLRPDSSESVANLGLLTALHAGIEIDIADLTGPENRLRCLSGVHNADLTHIVFETGDKRDELLAGTDLAVEYAYQKNNTLV